MKPLDLSHIKLQKPKKRTQDRQPSLLELKLDWLVVKNDHCPKPGCGLSLYWNRERTWIRCKSKLHTFKLPAQKYNDIVSGKTLADWKEQDKLNRR